MHLTSLPSPHGIGTMGAAARHFVEFLAAAGQTYWQILPICPTSFGDSPYQSFSTFAGNPYLIDLDDLAAEGLLEREEYEALDWGRDPTQVDYGLMYRTRYPVLRTACGRFLASPPEEYAAFCAENSFWLEDYAFFMALKERHGGAPWQEWALPLRRREERALAAARAELGEEIAFWQVVQYLFFRQWKVLKEYANAKGVYIIGDLPIYVSGDSVDVWASPQQFQLDGDLLPTEVAGCPPDGFSAEGQLWGNPLFDWGYMQGTGYDWWVRRIGYQCEIYDMLRIDHFRGFDSYYAIPYGAPDAKRGVWREGPGMKVFRAVEERLGKRNIIAEDLGFLTPSVRQLLKDSGFPGMKVLEFAFDSRDGGGSDYLPHNFSKHCVAYTGTHDNETILGWMESAPPADVAYAREYLRIDEREGANWTMMRGIWQSVANTAVIQIQDLLDLGAEGRMNEPSTVGKNWKWRAMAGFDSPALAYRVRREMKLYFRLPAAEGGDPLNQRAKDMITAMEGYLAHPYHTTAAGATPAELHQALSAAVMDAIAPHWAESKARHWENRHAYYLSAEFLVGRAVYNNLLCLGLTEQIDALLREKGAGLAAMEDVEDAALGNGGLGRLAACFLDSAATLSLPLDGYGIRYKYGLFKQGIEDGFQTEYPDHWSACGDPWSIRAEGDTVTVTYGDGTVSAVPYDMPILGYGTKNIGTLRLWQAEGEGAAAISGVLYPDDSTEEGKILRLKQEYFFTSASLQDILRKYEGEGRDLARFAEHNALQLNDTHPVLAIPELIRLLMKRGLDFDGAFAVGRNVFSYTNHTIMAEALETWTEELMETAIPGIFAIIEQIDACLSADLAAKGVDKEVAERMAIVQSGKAHMAYLAVYAGRYVNGVARLHTQILKDTLLGDWYALWPERFQNKTNGITQRRWLALCNPPLAKLITELLGSEGWLTDLSALRGLEKYADDKAVLERFRAIKAGRKEALADFVGRKYGIELDPATIFDVQCKRLHEYKRQLLNILAILELYFQIKEGELRDFTPTTFLFAGKAAPGYRRAKGIIKLIGAVSDLIAADEAVSPYLKVVFLPNYNVSQAEYLMAAADVSEQISTAGTEASGTGNMKLMANGAVTLGTLDGANVEIVEEAGEGNEYIFGAHVEEIGNLAEGYDPKDFYESDGRIRRVLDALVDGTLDDGGTGAFRELYDSLLEGASWHKADQYYLLLDFGRYLDKKIQVNREYREKLDFARKGWLNVASCGKFSSDRAIREYAEDIWQIEPTR